MDKNIINNVTQRGYIYDKKKLKEFLIYESKKYNRRNARMPLICVSEKSYLWKYNVLLRRTEYYVNTNNKIMSLIYRFRLCRYQNNHNIHIPINVFDRGLHLMHMGSFLVNNNAKVGKDISMHINTSIVAGGTNDDVPVLEDNIVIGVGATLLGKINIAKNIAIGANSLVNKTFQEESITIAGVPAKKISNNGRSEWNKIKNNE